MFMHDFSQIPVRKKIRNDVMHFRPTELDSQAAEAIDKCLNWLRAIHSS